MSGNQAAYWARGLDDSGKVIQHSFWLVRRRGGCSSGGGRIQLAARYVKSAAGFISADECEVIARM
jgi:hypothetical protein